MPSQLRDPKTLADWLDLDYFRRARRSGRLRRWLLVGTLAVSVVGVAALVASGRRTAFQAGPVSRAHASFNHDCEQCHVEGFRTLGRLGRLDAAQVAVPDAACTRCHAGPAHHETQVGDRACASCHKEHRGHEELARVADGYCTDCHADLKRNDGQTPAYDPHVTGFAAGRHPEFRLFAGGEPKDPGTVRFNHAVHLAPEGVWDIDPGQVGAAADGQRHRVRLECQSCHEPDETGRFLKPVRYADHCRSCHPLGVQLVGEWKEPRLGELAREFGRTPVPHPSPAGGAELVRGALRDRLTRFIQAAGRDGFLSGESPQAEDDGLLAPPRAAPLAREQFAWVNAQQAEVERLLFDGPGGCRYCHQEKTAPAGRTDGLPEYLPSAIPRRWLTHAQFDHKSHQMLNCVECHAAPDSRASADVLLPRIDTCRKCHGGAGQARSDCVECHTYHGHAGRAAFRGRLKIDREAATAEDRPMAKERKLVMNPPAELRPRPGDVSLAFDRFLDFSLFARLKKKPNVERFPGTLILRNFQPGEVICRQGEAGWTAFYPLTADDLLALRRQQLADAPEAGRPVLQAEVARLEVAAARAKEVGTPRPVATVYLALAGATKAPETSFLSRLGRQLFGHAARPVRRWLPYIAISNLREISHETRQATLYEGELFGEMSCVYGSPRSATVVAGEDCYALEMLRNILDEVQGDDGYRAHVDALYRERVLKNHLRRLPIFSDLTEEQFDRLRDGVELVRYKVGQVICAEHDRSDSMFIIRSGVVKAVKNASSLLATQDVADWAALCTTLPRGDAEPGPLAAVWQALPEPARQALRQAPDEARETLLHGLNAVIKEPPLPDPKNPKGVKELPPGAALAEHVAGLPKDAKQWPDLGRQRYGRLLLEAILPGAIRSQAGRQGPESVLSYLTAGEFIGEIGLMTGSPRTATCLAYAHPEPGQGHKKSGPSPKWRKDEALAELVRIPEALFRRLIAESAAVRAKVEETAAQRRGRSAALEQAPAWEDRRGLQVSGQFEELGLAQGRRLMLIDLARCTRCDECVRACVNTHDDGRTRLFLDGPRFGKYLVPATCRSCLDPVCMIGCPVGSIHRGDNREMVIENWCIGCGLCATNCPYGSIQMHDIGIIPEGSHGWRYYPAAALGGADWARPKYRDRRWLLGRTPFRHDLDLRARLQEVPAAGNGDAALCFRYEFQLQSGNASSSGEYRLEVTSTDGPLTVWLNGQEVTTAEKPKRGKREYRVPKEGGPLRPGRNVLAVRVTPTPADLETLLEARLDDVRRPVVPAGMVGDISEKLVTERAVVCDLCSGQYGQRPACVNACPHDAAMRVDALREFPG